MSFADYIDLFGDNIVYPLERHLILFALALLGATVLGVSGDSIEPQVKFSPQECRSKFLVASDPGLKIAKSYHAVILNLYADRTSYVIAPSGKIVYAYTSLDPDKHVANTLAALQALKASAN